MSVSALPLPPLAELHAKSKNNLIDMLAAERALTGQLQAERVSLKAKLASQTRALASRLEAAQEKEAEIERERSKLRGEVEAVLESMGFAERG